MNVQVWLPRGVTLALGALHSGNTLYRNVPTSGDLQSSLLQPLGQDAMVAAVLCRSCLCCSPCELSCCSQCPGSTWGPALRAGGDGSSGGIPQIPGEELGGWRRSGERATRCDGHDLCAQAGWGEAACGTGAWMNAALRGVRGDSAQGTAQRQSPARRPIPWQPTAPRVPSTGLRAACRPDPSSLPFGSQTLS